MCSNLQLDTLNCSFAFLLNGTYFVKYRLKHSTVVIICTRYLNIENLCILTGECTYIFVTNVRIKDDFFVSRINWLIFVMGTHCVLCEI